MKFSILPPTYEKVTWGFYFLDDILINQNKANFEKKIPGHFIKHKFSNSEE